LRAAAKLECQAQGERVKGLLIFVCVIGAACCQPQAHADDIDSLMRAANKVGVFNGTVLVAYKGKVIYEGALGYADSTKTRQLADDSLFYIGSIEKEFNGAGMLLLQQEGKLSLQDKVSKYLPDYPWAGAVEVGQLIDYTSGLPVSPYMPDSGLHDWLMKVAAPAEKPGTTYIYSYANVYVQQKIIEKISGQPYYGFVQSRLLQFCGILDVRADVPMTAPRVALPFTNSYKPVSVNGSTSPGLMFTSKDLSLWMNCLSENKILSGPSLDVLAKNFAGGESSLGSAVVENGKLSQHQHQGSGYNYEALTFSDGAAVIVLLTNNQNFKLFQLKDSILAILHGQPYTVPKKSIYLDIREGLASNFSEGMDAYLKLRSTGKDVYDFPSEPLDLINTGKYLMRRDKFDDAIAMFEMSLTFPLQPGDRSHAYELIADSWLKKGDKAMTTFYYEKALEADSGNKNAQGKLDGLKR
jgi:CubicO group peptidase (beta-lactamase class C family)